MEVRKCDATDADEGWKDAAADLLELVEGSAAPIEEVLDRAGYRLKAVDARPYGLREPFVVWLVAAEDGVEVEVYGQPALHADGATDHEAVAKLVDLMELVAEDSGDHVEAVGPARSVTEFLGRVVVRRGEERL